MAGPNYHLKSSPTIVGLLPALNWRQSLNTEKNTILQESNIVKIIKKIDDFAGLKFGCCGQTVCPTGLGHISLDSMGHGPSLLFCTIFFPHISWPGRPFKVTWVKIGQRPSKNAVFGRTLTAGHGRTGRPTGLTGTSVKPAGNAGFGDVKKLIPPLM